ASGDLSSMTDGSGTTQYVYGLGHGMLTQSTPPRGGPTLFSNFNSFGKPQTIQEPTGVTTTRAYDALGELTDSTHAQAVVWHRAHTDYDAFDRPVLQRRGALVGRSDDQLAGTDSHTP